MVFARLFRRQHFAFLAVFVARLLPRRQLALLRGAQTPRRARVQRLFRRFAQSVHEAFLESLYRLALALGLRVVALD